MATTHVFVGLALAAGVATVEPSLGGVAALAAILGGLFPDFDVRGAHRRTLHYPVYYPVVAVPAAAAALAAPSASTVFVAVFSISAALHSVSDLVGGGLSVRPWRGTADRAVYSHFHGRWLEPRRWIAYDGSPGDLAVGAVLAIPPLFVFDGIVRSLVSGLLVVSICYAVLRKPIGRAGEGSIGRNWEM